MSSRLLCAGVGLAVFLVCLGSVAQAPAKPPDLPAAVEDQYSPPSPSSDALLVEERGGAIFECWSAELKKCCGGARACGTEPAAREQTGRPLIPVKVRRNLATCLLFTIHPLLGLTPTDGVVDLPADHPFSTSKQEVQTQVQECRTGCIMIGVGFNSHGGLTGSIKVCDRRCPILNCLNGVLSLDSLLSPKTWVECWRQMAHRERTCPMREWVRCAERLLGQVKTQASACQKDDHTTDNCPSAARNNEEYCPWMRHHVRECQPTTVVDPQVTGDVLTNLQNLIDAQDLFKVADHLRHRGQVGEALDCYEIISKLCPGSQLDARANQARSLLVGSPYSTTLVDNGTISGSEEQSSKTEDTESVKEPCDWKTELKNRLKAPVTVDAAGPLTHVLEDIRNWQGLNIVLDTTALAEAGIDPETRVSLKVSNISLQSALNLFLHQARLKYVLKHEVILIVPEKRGQSASSAVNTQGACAGACLGAAVGTAAGATLSKESNCHSCPTQEDYPRCYTDPEEEFEPEANAGPEPQPGLPALDAGLVRYLESLGDDAEEQETKELEVIVEDQSPRSSASKIDVDLSLAPFWLLPTTCADIKLTPEQVELSWQVKVGPYIWQLRYGRAGCSVESLAVDTED